MKNSFGVTPTNTIGIPVLAAVAMASAPAVAQEMMLEEVVVTAQKREQSLQDVPVSLVAFGRDDLEFRAIDDLKDIGTDIPNLFINPFNNDPTAIRLFIRGIGQNDVQLTQDPSVALYLDGVYIGTSFGAGFEGVDVERLEVLRGPQGTLYGRNATGGAINIITQRANTENWMARQDLTGGNLDKQQSRTMVNIPLGDLFAVKFNYLYSNRGGYVENHGPGEDFGQEDRRSAVVDLRFEPSDVLTIDYRYENATLKDSQRLDQVRQLGSGGFLAPMTTYTDDVSQDRLDEVTALREIRKNDQDITAHTLFLDWGISDVLTFRSITALRNLDGTTYWDALPTATGDYTSLGRGVGAPSVGIFATEFEQKSQEFQLLGVTANWDFVAGLYYYEDSSNQDGTEGVVLGISDQTDVTTSDNTSKAAFAQGTWNPDLMAGRWHFTLGGRYSRDEREASRINDRATVPFAGKYTKDFSNFNPSLTVAYDITDTINVYGKAVSGYKSGGTSTRSSSAELFAGGFDEEDVLSYELGFKGDFWQSRARLNAAIFRMDIDGKQTSVQTDPVNPGGRDFLPVDGNRITGAEIDLNLLLTEGLTFTLGYGHLDAQLGQDTVTNQDGVTYQLTDKMPYAPDNSYTLALNYQKYLANGVAGFNINYGWQDEVTTSVNQADVTTIDSYGLLGASLHWSDIRMGQVPGSFRVLLWGKNLTDEDYGLVNTAAWTVFGAPDVTNFGDPRTVGLTLSYMY